MAGETCRCHAEEILEGIDMMRVHALMVPWWWTCMPRIVDFVGYVWTSRYLLSIIQAPLYLCSQGSDSSFRVMNSMDMARFDNARFFIKHSFRRDEGDLPCCS